MTLTEVSMKRAAVYMRVSTAGQEKEETIGNQAMELRERIEADGHTLLPDCIYKDEGWSGTILERPDLDKMRTDASEKRFDVLYVYDRGRLARKFVYQEIVLEEILKHGIEFISLHDINGESSEEKLMGGVMGLFHEYERVKITERMRIGKIRKVKENKKLLGYIPRYGYNYHPRIKNGANSSDGYFSINKEQAKVVKMIFEWSAEGISKYAIRNKLYTMGIPPLKGKKPHWSTSVIDRILRDTTYYGEHYYNKSESVETKNPRTNEKYRKTVKGSRIARPKEEWLMVRVDKIITKKLHDKVQIQLARNKKFSARNNSKNQYMVSGLIECPCGTARTGDPANNSLYYRCCDRLNNACGTRKCYERGVNVPVLDSLVWNNLKELLLNPELVFEQAKLWQAKTSPLEKQIERLRDRIEKLNEKQARYIKIYGDGDMSEQDYKTQKYEADAARAGLLNEISGIEQDIANKPSLPLDKLVDGVVKLVEDLDFADKQQIIRKIVTKVVATQKEVTVWGHIPVLATEQIGLNVKYRHRRSPKRRKIDVI